MSFIDDYIGVSWSFLLEHKSDVCFVLPNFHNRMKNQFGVTIKRFRLDNVGDYFNHVPTPYFHHEGIIYELSCVNTAQQNGVAERKNGHLLDAIQVFFFPKTCV